MKAMKIFLVDVRFSRWYSEHHIVLATDDKEAIKTADIEDTEDAQLETENLLAVLVPDDTPPRVLNISYMDFT